ncbi:MAG: universal stress protein [Microthrixaceae bacterium]|nr:universal stress protein [Microthrixaceae bacterium]MCO5314270.1 universal stress protein [Microthrixaceae bacterium]HPB44253.1 universal stress protein [Microthrixaceae bacterium]
MTSVSNEQPVVIVGVDGSPNSLAALEWAINFAAGQGGGTVKAVMSWTYPAAAVGSMGIGGVMPPAESMHEASAEALDEILADVVAPDSVTVQPVIAEGGASPAILELADDADLIVIGKRGHGGFLGLLIGSVATQIVNHAPCPVVVVPAG